MINLSELYNIVRRYAPDVPKKLMLESLQRAHRTFCEKTGAYHQIRLIATDPGQSDYKVSVPGGFHIYSIIYAREENTNTFLDIHHNEQSLRQGEVRNRPQQIAPIDLNEIRLYPTPDNTYRYSIKLIFRPELNATHMDDVIYSEYGEGIAYGACADLLMMPNKSWTNPNMSIAMERKFKAKKMEAKSDQVDVRSGVMNGGWAR